MSGIQSIASYLPGFEMQRSVITAQLAWFDPNLKAQAKGVRRVANWDEDAITMAVAAALYAALLWFTWPLGNQGIWLSFAAFLVTRAILQALWLPRLTRQTFKAEPV